MSTPTSATVLPTFSTRVLPVIVIDKLAQAVPLAQALLAGGVDAMEITLRTPVAMDAISAVAHAVPQMCVGAGTVLDAQDLHRVRDAGARFALSPGAGPDLLAAAAAGSLPFIPGVMTACEALAAREHGFGLLKLFPAEQAGGLALLQALAAPLADLRFCPTGGLTAGNAMDYLALPNVTLVGGSWLAPRAALAHGDWATITALASATTKLVKSPPAY
ncbi:bifunctional 4-hydroxy-2-oxoglutarate aldolase/2-dehydro-3-deoxy-phosphogluconate aldolase [Comamonas sp. GB3 AK4-5]|uniref:bifunctional 4-hydroxy-2-oxoglutarate aldolase/2-dehydro-3-deoxy-phosphogluconate aldolase n=1 Tax=Comamonas sp. GB3 AK4-5 TaxID=3231487 RepID=UPI00351EC438